MDSVCHRDLKTDLDPNLHVVCGSWHSLRTEITLLTKPHRMSSLWSQKWYHPIDPRCSLLLGDYHTDVTFSWVKLSADGQVVKTCWSDQMDRHLGYDFRHVSPVLPFSGDRWIIDFAETAPRAVFMLFHPLSNSCYSFFPLIRCVHWWHLGDWQIVILLECGLIYTEPIISRQIDQLDIAMLIMVFIIPTPD